MCIAVCYDLNKQNHIVNFSDSGAKIPVYTRQGTQLVLWGRRKIETGVLPYGGNISKESLNQGLWDKYFPKKIRLPIQNFEILDLEGESKWFIVTHGCWLEGVILRDTHEIRVYLLMLSQIPKEPQGFYAHWPSIIVGDLLNE